MIIERFGDYNLKDITLISSLPDMGRVGGLVTDHLVKSLVTKLAIKISVSDKPWVNQEKGLISVPVDEYKLFVDEKNSIVIFTGQNQPQEPSTVIELSEQILSLAQSIGNIKLIISTGGYFPVEQNENKKVYGIATNQGLLEFLKSLDVPVLGEEVNSITWFNGLILGKAKQQNIDGIGLFGEIFDADTPQFMAASNIIKTIEKILNLKIRTDELDAQKTEPTIQPSKSSPGVG